MRALPMVMVHRKTMRQRGSSTLRVYSKDTPRMIRATRTTTRARYRLENMVAYQAGKAAKITAPATISQTSLPSQNGPTELMA